jgi:acyl-coenzyme A synthetase/AMP-(fatty) acid ligase
MAAGYFRREELSAQRFIDGNERAYKSGDLAVLLPSGEFDYRGRRDDQVKLRGFRIEMAEVEAVLGAHSAVDGAATTVLWGQESGEGVLVAILVLCSRDNEQIPGIRSLCREQLPGYMVPNRFLIADSLPLTASGKLDRAALPDLARSLQTASV